VVLSLGEGNATPRFHQSDHRSSDRRGRPGHAFAETSFKRPLIACLVGGSKVAAERYFGGFPRGMRELGYVEGRDYGFEVHYAEGV